MSCVAREKGDDQPGGYWKQTGALERKSTLFQEKGRGKGEIQSSLLSRKFSLTKVEEKDQEEPLEDALISTQEIQIRHQQISKHTQNTLLDPNNQHDYKAGRLAHAGL